MMDDYDNHDGDDNNDNDDDSRVDAVIYYHD
jgi:hypothetical protein